MLVRRTVACRQEVEHLDVKMFAAWTCPRIVGHTSNLEKVEKLMDKFSARLALRVSYVDRRRADEARTHGLVELRNQECVSVCSGVVIVGVGVDVLMGPYRGKSRWGKSWPDDENDG